MAQNKLDNVVKDLIAALGSERVETSLSALTLVMSDESGFHADRPPVCVVYPESTEDVQSVVRCAALHDVPVTIRGAGTGLTGASMGSHGEIVLSTLRMNQVLEIDFANRCARVQAGVINGDFDDLLRENGFWFAPDPASRKISSIGGNVATNAGGLMCAKYGVTREAVLSAVVVLADGSSITVGRSTVKGVTGLDLTALFVGSEGILGVISEVTVKILPVSDHPVVTLSAYFSTVNEAAVASARVTENNLQPAVMEIMDSQCLAAVHEYLNISSPHDRASHILIQFDGADAEVQALSCRAILENCGARDVDIASDSEAEALLEVRRSVHPSLARLGTTLIEDVCVPRSKLGEMFDEIARISAKYSVSIPTVCHAGDGNLHPNFIFDGEVVPEHIWEAASEIFAAALALGGTLTGEHGVGFLKSRWLRDELGPRQYQLQQDIKHVFDPHSLFNRGRVFS